MPRFAQVETQVRVSCVVGAASEDSPGVCRRFETLPLSLVLTSRGPECVFPVRPDRTLGSTCDSRAGARGHVLGHVGWLGQRSVRL